jgi:hypothetical protein
MREHDVDDEPEGREQPGADARDAQDHSDPASDASDPLTRRSFLGRMGASTAAVAVTAAGLPGFSLVDAQAVDWHAIAKQSVEAFRISVNEWIGQARVQGGKVSGSAAVLPAGSLNSDVDIEKRMIAILAASRVPAEVSAPVAAVLAGAWHDWAASFQMQIPGAYPTLAAVPARSAPPTKASVSPVLSQGTSAGEASLSAPVLAKRLTAAVRMHPLGVSQASPEQAMQDLAAWVDASFTRWKSAVRLTSLVGTGPVPTYAPPYVPVGPVTQGVTTSAGPLFAGARFGIVGAP